MRDDRRHAFPLVFNFRDLIAGRGFVAAIETAGRVVLAEEAPGWTLYGVNPGGISGGAEDRTAALADFRQSYQEVLDDIAHEARDFDAFKAAVEALVNETNDDVAEEWSALRDRVRCGDITLDMGRHEGNFVPGVIVRRVEEKAPRENRPTPALNPQGTYTEAA